MTYRKILVPLDGSRFAERALPRALALAGAWDASIELATVAQMEQAPPEDRSPDVPGDQSRERGMAAAEAYLEDLQRRIEASGYQGPIAARAIPPGNVASALARHLQEVGADLCVMTTHGRNPVQRAWLGSAADGLIRRSPSPVLLLRSADPGGDGETDLAETPEPFGLILLPLDGSEASERLLSLVAPLTAGAPDPRVVLLRAVPPFVPGGSPYLPQLVRESHEHEQVEAAAERYLESVAARAREQGLTVDIRVVTAGEPAVAILQASKDGKVDLVAMATHGRGGVARMLLGSVADKVVRGSEVPVLLHRDPEA